MKRKILLTLVMTAIVAGLQAQKKQQNTAYAITGVQKGQNNWTEVRLVDMATGEEIKTVYQSAQEIETLNARTGKPVVKKDLVKQSDNLLLKQKIDLAQSQLDPTGSVRIVKKINNTNVQNNINTNVNTNINSNVNTKVIWVEKTAAHQAMRVQSDKPFSTNSAACAYDKKHERLYYTPMGINELRYIDLNAKTPKIYYFENEPFGALKSPRDIPNQITRMVIAADGDGYALTNDGNHLIKFTTGKKTVITDLGALTDDGANGSYSVHSQSGYGGDMIADNQDNLYLITANRAVYKISITTKLATYMGSIKGLPKGYTTNGAAVESGSMVIVNSSNSTLGYYRFDLTSMQAEKLSNLNTVFNSSDLANGNLAFDKKKKDRKQPDILPPPAEVKPETPVVVEKQKQSGSLQLNEIAVFPNPARIGGSVKLSFVDQPEGSYQIQFMDVAGKIVSQQEINIGNKLQVETFRIPAAITSGNYLVKVTNLSNKASTVSKVFVE